MFVVKYKERDYKNQDVWGYIGNVRQIAVKEIDPEIYLKMYENLPHIEDNCCEYIEDEKLPKEVLDINKIFTIVTNEIKEEFGEIHCENLVFDYDQQMPIYAVLLYIEDSKEFGNILLLTNQTTYLMNDKGQTIERLL